jgi:hypothetical protein
MKLQLFIPTCITGISFYSSQIKSKLKSLYLSFKETKYEDEKFNLGTVIPGPYRMQK